MSPRDTRCGSHATNLPGVSIFQARRKQSTNNFRSIGDYKQGPGSRSHSGGTIQFWLVAQEESYIELVVMHNNDSFPETINPTNIVIVEPKYQSSFSL